MSGINCVNLAGNVGRDPEMKFTQGGTAVLKFSVAINERRKVGEKWEDQVEWVNCVAWSKRAEGLAKVLTKGTPVAVVGKLRTRSWEDKDGNKRYSTEVHVDDVALMGGRKREGGGGLDDGDSRSQQTGDDFGSDDIPFATSVIVAPRQHRVPKWERF